jgi:hypothetical protein
LNGGNPVGIAGIGNLEISGLPGFVLKLNDRNRVGIAGAEGLRNCARSMFCKPGLNDSNPVGIAGAGDLETTGLPEFALNLSDSNPSGIAGTEMFERLR